jgi:hypothetical protein
MTTPAWLKNPGKSWLIMAAGILAFSAVLGGLSLVLRSAPQFAWYGVVAALFGLLIAGTVLSYRRSQREIVISVTGDGLTVNTRPGDLYSFHGAKLGTWGVTRGATMGTALHLQCGPRRFILGGRDRRVSAETRLDAEDVGYGMPVDIDAWLSASEFEEILTMLGGRSGLEVPPPSPREPTRCLLFPNALLVANIGSFAFGKRQQFMESVGHPKLAIDVGEDAIRVIDPTSNSVVASVSPRQATAAPATYRKWSRPWLPDAGLFINDFLENYLTTMPCMVVSIPGLQPLTIATRDTVSGVDHRFSWRDEVPVRNELTEYEVTGMDWLTLVETFGLSRYLA